MQQVQFSAVATRTTRPQDTRVHTVVACREGSRREGSQSQKWEGVRIVSGGSCRHRRSEQKDTRPKCKIVTRKNLQESVPTQSLHGKSGHYPNPLQRSLYHLCAFPPAAPVCRWHGLAPRGSTSTLPPMQATSTWKSGASDNVRSFSRLYGPHSRLPRGPLWYLRIYGDGGSSGHLVGPSGRVAAAQRAVNRQFLHLKTYTPQCTPYTARPHHCVGPFALMHAASCARAARPRLWPHGA